MSWKNALVDYAKTRDPAGLPSEILLMHTEQTLTIWDKYPKAMFQWVSGMARPLLWHEVIPLSLNIASLPYPDCRLKNAKVVMTSLRLRSTPSVPYCQAKMLCEFSRYSRVPAMR
jgi:hypothetical protein